MEPNTVTVTSCSKCPFHSDCCSPECSLNGNLVLYSVDFEPFDGIHKDCPLKEAPQLVKIDCGSTHKRRR